MVLPDESLQSIKEEEAIFQQVKDSLESQLLLAQDKLQRENKRARALTKQIHETSRVDDKALLASDEAVAHGLKDEKRLEIDRLHKQLSHPYFARITLEEECNKRGLHHIEYKLGYHANIELRIIDWRKAPISKLYYEYKEGEDYIEEILGRERIGRVTLRNRVDVKEANLVGVTNRHGAFRWDAQNARWMRIDGKSGAPREQAGQLPSVLSLITPEQFRSITVDADSAILIQGIAGSGKTTVALYRISWLLHEDNSPLTMEQTLCLVRSPVLRSYIGNSLPALGLDGIHALAYHEWACKLLTRGDTSRMVHRSQSSLNLEVRRFKRSFRLLEAIESSAPFALDAGPARKQLELILVDILGKLRLEVASSSMPLDGTTDKTLKAVFDHTRSNFEQDMFDWEDDALLLRIFQLSNRRDEVCGTWGHIMADEVQDLSPTELATIVASVKNHSGLTLVGDTFQNLDATEAFPGWKQLCKHWNFTDDMSRYISLEISHRSTRPIMQLANYVQGHEAPTHGRPGRTPIWFRCKDESQGVIYASKWLNKATTLYPNMLVAVLCSSMKEASAAFKLLEPTFKNSIRLGSQASFSFDNGIVVTEVSQVKGLEFHSVLMWNPSRWHYPQNAIGRNSLYVGITRAEENLSLVTWDQASKLLPKFHTSSLIRKQDIASWSEDEQ